MNDLRFSLRSLRRAPSFTLATVLTLAIGIGSAAAIFSVADYALFRSLNYPPDLVMLGAKSKRAEFSPITFAAPAAAYRNLNAVFRDVAVSKSATVNVVVDGEPVSGLVSQVSSNFFSVVGATPVQGRGFVPADENRHDVVVISEQFRRQVFHDDVNVLGRKIIVDDTPCTIVGVLAARQNMPVLGGAPLYQPLALRPDAAAGWQQWLFTFARLQPGVTTTQADAAMATVRLEAPAAMKDFLAEMQPRAATLRDAQTFMRRDVYWVMIGAVGFLYAIAALNATNLMVVRLLGRRRELSIRLALGGGRIRLIRLLLWDAVIIAGLAGLLGLLVANWLDPVLMALGQAQQTFEWGRWRLDWRAVAVLVGLTVLTSLLIVLVPAMRILRSDPQQALKEGGTALGETRALARVRSGFVVLQAAFAVILLTGAGLMVRTFSKLDDVPLGFETYHRIKLKLSFPPGYVGGNEERHAFLQRLQNTLTHTPGVASAAYGTDTLLRGFNFPTVKITMPDEEPIQVSCDKVSANFFATSGMVLKRGEMIKENDWKVLISESLAHKRFGDADPVGKVIHKTADQGSGESDWIVAGVVGDVRYHAREQPGYEIYTPETWWSPNIDTFVLQTTREPDAAMISAIKRTVYRFDAKLVIYQIASLDEIRGWDRGMEVYVTAVLKVLSGFALVLAVVGMFSVLAYTVDRRMGEFGIRLALGATPRDLVRLVMARGVMLAVAGVVIGLFGALALVRYVRALLYQTPPHDPVVLGTVALLLVGAAVFACALPARRASRIDVAKLLRAE